MTEHELLLVLLEFAVLVLAARVGAEIAARLGVAQVVGELLMGIAIGPSLVGKIWPRAFLALFPRDVAQRSFLDLLSWVGVVFLVLLAGLEMRLGILRNAGRAVASGWVGGFFLPFVMGFALGWVVPDRLVGSGVDRPVFALFLATAMSISAIPVIARILLDLGLLKTRIGMLVISTAVADDTVGWIVLAIVTGLARSSRFDAAAVLVAIGGTAAFLLFAATLGQRAVRWAMQASTRLRIAYAQTTVMLLVVLAFGAITQALHVHLVLGCLVGGVLVARSPARDRIALESVRMVGMALFVPFFFAYTGIRVDLTTLTGAALPVTIAAVAVACIGKLVGGSVGASVGGLPFWEAMAVGSGLNARGGMGLVIAAIGLSIGVLTVPTYTIIVVIAILTSLMAAPMLRTCARRAGVTPRPSFAVHKEVVA